MDTVGDVQFPVWHGKTGFEHVGEGTIGRVKPFLTSTVNGVGDGDRFFEKRYLEFSTPKVCRIDISSRKVTSCDQIGEQPWQCNAGLVCGTVIPQANLVLMLHEHA